MVSSFTIIVYLQCIHMIYVISTSSHYLRITGINWLTRPARLHSSVGRALHRYRGYHGSNISRWSLRFFSRFLCNCLSCFITARITFTCILSPQCTYMIFMIYTTEFFTCWPNFFLVPILRGILVLLFLASKERFTAVL